MKLDQLCESHTWGQLQDLSCPVQQCGRANSKLSSVSVLFPCQEGACLRPSLLTTQGPSLWLSLQSLLHLQSQRAGLRTTGSQQMLLFLALFLVLSLPWDGEVGRTGKPLLKRLFTVPRVVLVCHPVPAPGDEVAWMTQQLNIMSLQQQE